MFFVEYIIACDLVKRKAKYTLDVKCDKDLSNVKWGVFEGWVSSSFSLSFFKSSLSSSCLVVLAKI